MLQVSFLTPILTGLDGVFFFFFCCWRWQKQNHHRVDECRGILMQIKMHWKWDPVKTPMKTVPNFSVHSILTWWLCRWRKQYVSISCCRKSSWMTTSSPVHRTDPNYNPGYSCRYHIPTNWFRHWSHSTVLDVMLKTDRRQWPINLNAPNSWPIVWTAPCWIHGSDKQKETQSVAVQNQNQNVRIKSQKEDHGKMQLSHIHTTVC